MNVYKYPKDTPEPNQTVFIRRENWNKWLPAKFTSRGFECKLREHRFTFERYEHEYNARLVTFWSD